MAIGINKEALDDVANSIDQWAEELKEYATTSANQKANEVLSMNPQDFQGQAATKYREKFEEVCNEIVQAIETISDQQLASLRDAMRQIGQSFEDADASFSF